jgi:hypothetical protein
LDNEERRNRKWIFVILAFFAVISMAPYRLMNEYYIYIAAYMWFGIAYGMCLQYGRFCFASAFRDLFAVRVPRMVVGIMIAMVFFSLVGAFATTVGASAFHPAPFGVIHVIIAGAIFGVGMVLAGGCASGSLYKIGEGNGVSMIVVLALSVSQAIFVDIAGWTNKLVPQSWHDAALRKGLPKVINVGDGWMDQYLAGYVWNKPPIRISETQVIAENFGIAKYFVGDSLLNVIIPAVLLLIVIYIFWSRKIFMRNRIKEGKSSRGFKANLTGYWSMIVSSKRTAIAGLALGIFAGLHMFVMRKLQLAFGVQNFGELMTRMGIDFGISARGTVFDPGYWYVTTQEAQWIGWLFNKLGWNNMDNIYFGLTNGIPNPLFNPADWMSLGLIGGAMMMALAHKEFRWKKPTKELAMWAIIGGTLMGIGSRLALGCNVGAFFVRISMGDPSGWMFGIGMVGGAYGGVKFFNWWTERKMAKEMEAF